MLILPNTGSAQQSHICNTQNMMFLEIIWLQAFSRTTWGSAKDKPELQTYISTK
jgi:hypothetical protein